MKFLLALVLTLFTSVAFACTNFSGTYKDEIGTYSVQQSGCESVLINSNEGTETIITDGQFRVTEENEEVRISSSATFIGNNLTIEGKIEYLVALPPEMPIEMIPVKTLTIFTLDAAGNLWMNFSVYNSNGQIIDQATTMHPRV